MKFYTSIDASVSWDRVGPHAVRRMRSATVRAKLRDPFSVMIHFFLPQRSFGSWRKTDFFNRIGQKSTLQGDRHKSALPQKSDITDFMTTGLLQSGRRNAFDRAAGNYRPRQGALPCRDRRCPWRKGNNANATSASCYSHRATC